MNTTQPFGDLKTANMMVIGHDPRLQRSKAEAETAFFFDYLRLYLVPPGYGPEASKYSLAHAVWDYVTELAGRPVPLETLYVTNLCNEFLPPTLGRGTVLIPEEQATHGVEAIRQAVVQGNFRLILPMSLQTFYHLCRLGFVDEDDERIKTFVKNARPSPAKAEQGIYASVGKAPFLEVCGQCFHHQGIPVVPILHVKQWPIKAKAVRYTVPMKSAKREVRRALTD